MSKPQPFIRAIRQKSALHALIAVAMDTFADTATKHWPDTYHGNSRADVVELQRNCVDLDVFVAGHMFELRIRQDEHGNDTHAEPATRGEYTAMEFVYTLNDTYTVEPSDVDALQRYVRKEVINYIKKERARQHRAFEGREQ